MGRVGFEPLSEFRASWEMPHIVFHLLGMVLCMIGSEGSALMAGMACLQANLADEDAGEGGGGGLASRPALLCSPRTINPLGLGH